MFLKLCLISVGIISRQWQLLYSTVQLLLDWFISKGADTSQQPEPTNKQTKPWCKQFLYSWCSTKDLAWHLQCFAFSDVFVPLTILFKIKMNNILIILFHCSRPFQRYQIWYDNNYLNLNNSQARLLEGVVLVALHRATSRDVTLLASIGPITGLEIGCKRAEESSRAEEQSTDQVTYRALGSRRSQKFVQMSIS